MPIEHNVPPLGLVEFPELFVALSGPIGVDIGLLVQTVQTALTDLSYGCEPIKLTREMDRFPITSPTELKKLQKYSGVDTFNTYMRKMSAANALRKQHDDGAILARIAIDSIIAKRSGPEGNKFTAAKEERKLLPKRAYIISQLKRPEEVELLRTVYGDQFILISAYSPVTKRRKFLADRLRRELPTSAKEIDIDHQAEILIDRDASEDSDDFGQQLRDTFHLADVFIDGADRVEMAVKLKRFFEAFFGRNDITPSRDEYGMYMAKSAALRSADLARQVGAAIFTPQSEPISIGCNDVPKAGGGTYWNPEEPDFRDIKKGFDPNDIQKKEIVRDLIERFRREKLLSAKALALGGDDDIANALITKGRHPDQNGALVGSRLMDLTEFGRVVHAEMHALLEAVRLGRSVKGAILYCTTFPCHNCTKHLLAAGISRVIYMEPYPKSKAKELHEDEVEIESFVESKLSFLPFMGISPLRYRGIFQKGKRKDSKGNAQTWYKQKRRPMLNVLFPAYSQNEIWALSPLIGSVKTRDTRTANLNSKRPSRITQQTTPQKKKK